MGGNTLRALASDLGYLEGCNLATGFPLPWPAPESLLLKFVAHHLWDPVKRARIRTTACRGRGGRVARSSPAGSKKPPCSQHDAPTADELVDPDPLAGLTRVLRRPLAQIRVAARSARERATKTTRKQEGRHGRHSGQSCCRLAVASGWSICATGPCFWPLSRLAGGGNPKSRHCGSRISSAKIPFVPIRTIWPPLPFPAFRAASAAQRRRQATRTGV